jgi:hypothetical protein
MRLISVGTNIVRSLYRVTQKTGTFEKSKKKKKKKIEEIQQKKFIDRN